MYCSKCGATIANNQAFCSGCGHPTPTAPSGVAELQRFENRVRRLSRCWYGFAGLSLVLGLMGLFAVQTGISNHIGPWEPWPHPYIWNWTLSGSSAWILLSVRLAAAVAAGWGLARHTDWSRTIALAAAAFAFTQFPIGLVLAVYTFSVLLGKHNAELYRRLVAPGNLVEVR